MIDNPYWETVKHLVSDMPDPTWGTVTLGGWRKAERPGGSRDIDRLVETHKNRRIWVNEFSWAVTDPDSVSYVARQCQGEVYDPMAGTGYWAYMLGQEGVTVHASDLNPPEPGAAENVWHQDIGTWVDVTQADAVDAVARAKPYDTLLLSWPPYSDLIAAKTLSAFNGVRLIYIGEGAGGCTGDDTFHEMLDHEWVLVDDVPPVQYDGLHDVIYVFDRISRRNRFAGRS